MKRPRCGLRKRRSNTSSLVLALVIENYGRFHLTSGVLFSVLRLFSSLFPFSPYFLLLPPVADYLGLAGSDSPSRAFV